MARRLQQQQPQQQQQQQQQPGQQQQHQRPSQQEPAQAPACQVGPWGDYGECARTGVNQWSKTRSRQVVQQGSRCPRLTQTVGCEPPMPPMPADEAAALRQMTLGVVTALPLSIAAALDEDNPLRAPGAGEGLDGKAVAPGEIAAGRRKWEQQVDGYDSLTCLPFNGPAALLSAAGAAPEAEVQATVDAAAGRAREAVAAARGAFNATARAAAARAVVAQQAGAGGVASVFWDGTNTLGVAFKPSADMSDDEAATASTLASDTLSNLVPWLRVQESRAAGGAGAARLNLSVAYDAVDEVATFNTGPSGALALLSAVQRPLQSVYGLSLPQAAAVGAGGTDVQASAAQLAVSAAKGVKDLMVALAGAWTPSSLSRGLGMSWSLPDGMFTVQDPTVLYNALPSVLYTVMRTDVPLLGAKGMTATLNMQPGQQASLQLFGPTTPVPNLAVDRDLILTATPSGLLSTAEGVLVDLPVSLNAAVTGKGVSAALSNTWPKASVNKLLGVLFPAGQVPKHVADFVAPMSFSRVTVTYDGSGGGGSKAGTAKGAGGGAFSLLAVPDLDGAPALKSVLTAVGLGVTDVALQPRGAAVALGLQEPFHTQLPAPLSGDSATLLSLEQRGSEAVLAGALQAALALPGVAAPVGLQLSAAVATQADADGRVAAAVRGSPVAPVSFNDFEFVQLGPMQLAADVAYGPLELRQLSLHGPVSVLGTAGRGAFDYDPASGALVFAADLPRLDVSALAQAVGAKLRPGALGAQLSSVRQTYAAAAVDDLGVGAGMRFAGDVEFAGMSSRTAFELTKGGANLVAVFNSTEFTKAFAELVLPRAVGVLSAAAAAIPPGQAAAQGADTPAPQQAGAAQLDQAVAEMLEAQKKFDAAASAYEAAKRTAFDTLASAGAKAASAAAAFAASRGQKQRALDATANKLRAADADYVGRVVKAFGDLNKARASVFKSETEYSTAVGDAQVSVEIAQATVSELQSGYNHHNSRCDAWPWTQESCAAAANAWVAYQAASRRLSTATAALGALSTGAAAGKLAAARSALIAAQAAANAVSTGASWKAREAAATAAAAASTAVAGLTNSSEWAALTGANQRLEAAQAASTAAVAGSPEWLALDTAAGALDAATAKVYAAQAATQATAADQAAAAEALAGALEQVTRDGFLLLGSFGASFSLSKEASVMYASYDVTLAGTQRLMGRFAVDVGAAGGQEETKLLLVRTLAGEVVRYVRGSNPALAAFLA